MLCISQHTRTLIYGVYVCAVVPVHLRGGALPEVNAQTFVPFKQITIANLRPHPELEGMSIYWLHLGLAYVFVLYALWLMNYHYKVCRSHSGCHHAGSV